MPRARTRISVSALMVATVGGLAVSGARADNPKLNLKLENVTVREAAARLTQASGVNVSTWDTPDGPQPPELMEKASFDWTGVPFSRAFRQLCERFHLQPMRQPVGYQLYPGAPPVVVKAHKPVGLFQAQGVRMSARQLVIAAPPRVLNFGGEEFDQGDGNLQLTVACQLDELDADRIAGIRNVKALDDKGTVLTLGPEAEVGADFNPSAYPDEWLASLGLPEPNPAARKLVSVEGDLMVFKKFQHHRAEITLPLSEKRVEKKVGPLTLVVTDYQPPAAPSAPKEKEKPIDGDAPAESRAAQVKIRLYYPANLEGGALNQWSQPLLRLQSGRVVQGGWEGNGGESEGETAYMDLRVRFEQGENVRDAPAAILWSYLDRAEPVKLVHFRMADVPLPPVRPWRAPKVVKPMPEAPGGPATPNHAFFDEAGGTLVTRIEREQAAAGAGRLMVGLMPLETPSAAVRWIDLDVEASGEAKLPNIRPGKYRLLRRFKPAEGDFPANGRWVNAELSVEIQAGKEAAVAALRWTIAPPPVSKPTAMPRPKK